LDWLDPPTNFSGGATFPTRPGLLSSRDRLDRELIEEKRGPDNDSEHVPEEKPCRFLNEQNQVKISIN
jgi:hypothetical protein